MPKGNTFPLDWPALEHWANVRKYVAKEGFTMCSVVSPDLKAEYGNTGSAMVWEMFDSIAYDADKFSAMMDRSLERFAKERKVILNSKLKISEKVKAISELRETAKKEIGEEGKFRLPPKGFSIKNALMLFEMTGDYKKK